MAEMIPESSMNRAFLTLLYDGKDISTDITASATSFSYTDHDGGKADDLQVSLEDIRGLWKGAWFPQKGAILKAGIRAEFGGKINTLDCGVFAIDEISVQGPPDTVNFKAVSSFTAKSLKRENKSRAWENRNLKEIASGIAGEHKLIFFYDTSETVGFDRLEQREESDLAFLKRVCEDHDLNLKISGEKLIIYESRTMEKEPSVFSVVRGKSAVSRYSFTTKTVDLFRGCQVNYWDAEKKRTHTHIFIPPDGPPVGQLLKVNQRMENGAAAAARAKSALRKTNQQEITGEFDLMGDPALLAGLTGRVDGFGGFDGKYIITQAVHTQNRNQGYRTRINIRKALSW